MNTKMSRLLMMAVTVSAFYIEMHEVTKQLWDDVYSWAISNGYAFENEGYNLTPNHPVCRVAWYDCVKWCNARSARCSPRNCSAQDYVSYATGLRCVSGL